MPESRRPKHPHSVSSFTRSQRKDHNMHPEPHYHMTADTDRAIRKYNAYVRKTKKGKTGGRRHRKHRSTRRH